MANVHNHTAYNLNFTYSTLHGPANVAVGPWPGFGLPPFGVAHGITAGPDHAALLLYAGQGSFYPGIHMGNIDVSLNGAGNIDIAYRP
ncbi:MAG: hypothetical protein M9939_21040 [Mesorhizobium sp.]|nr:hypothetical protein [Mesorhizobium sp.]MCO5163622.1 hypothetical protein [Mesorhizobium sp.]